MNDEEALEIFKNLYEQKTGRSEDEVKRLVSGNPMIAVLVIMALMRRLDDTQSALDCVLNYRQQAGQA